VILSCVPRAVVGFFFPGANTPANGTDVSGLKTHRTNAHVCSVAGWTGDHSSAGVEPGLHADVFATGSCASGIILIKPPPPPAHRRRCRPPPGVCSSKKTLSGMVFFHHLRSISHSLANVLGRSGLPPRAALQPSPLQQQRPFWLFSAADSFLRPQQQQQVRAMSKYLSKSAKKRIPLNTKRVAKGFYKGKGCTKEGRITKKAKFMVDKTKQLELVVPPDLANFRLKPYISADASRFPPERRHTPVS
jgi:hypothetical protein